LSIVLPTVGLQQIHSQRRPKAGVPQHCNKITGEVGQPFTESFFRTLVADDMIGYEGYIANDVAKERLYTVWNDPRLKTCSALV
jgi:hypothetical protein